VEERSEESRIRKLKALRSCVPVGAGCGACLYLSFIRLEPLREPGQKDTAYDNIVFRYVLIGKLPSIILTNREAKE
jgi:hypothetical protein